MNSRLNIIDTPLQGLMLIQREPMEDTRGYLERLYCAQELDLLVPSKRIVQVNLSLTKRRGAVRGMHFQRAPHTETKFVTCLRGAVFDVAIDVRSGSATFLQWHAEILSAENHKTFLIPEGYAHGFQTLAEDCELLYLHTAAYEPAAESGLNPEDPGLAICWPVPISELSVRDRAHAMIADGFDGTTP